LNNHLSILDLPRVDENTIEDENTQLNLLQSLRNAHVALKSIIEEFNNLQNQLSKQFPFIRETVIEKDDSILNSNSQKGQVSRITNMVSALSKNVRKYAEVGYQRLGTIPVRLSDEDFTAFTTLTSHLCDRCQLVDKWNDATFNGWLYLSFITITLCSLFIVLYTRNITSRNTLSASLLNTSSFSEAWKTVVLYPIALLVAYIPAQIYALYYNQYSGTAKIGIIANYLVALNSCYGLFLSIIFYTKTEGALNEWKILLRWDVNAIDLNDIEFRSTSNDLPKELENTMSNK
jgi:hypothetical protein